jgi:hypothetical protein
MVLKELPATASPSLRRARGSILGSGRSAGTAAAAVPAKESLDAGRCREQKKDLHMILLTWRRRMTKCLGMSCGGLCRSTKFHQSTLPSLRICTIML